MTTEAALDYTVIWVCTDCMLVAAGYDAHELGYEPDCEPWNRAGADWSQGLPQSEHICAWGTEDDPDPRDNDEDECETRTFSWTPCEACGSTLGGGRYSFTRFHD